MPLEILSHPVEFPDVLFSVVFEFGNTTARPFSWIAPVRPFHVNNHIVFLYHVDGSELISEMAW